MELLFIDKELSESRLYRTSNQMRKLSGKDIANLLYLNTLALYLLNKDGKKNRKYSANYSKKTSQYNNYKSFKTNATDVYMLGHVITNFYHYVLADHGKSVEFLKRIHFDDQRHIKFMRTLSTEPKKVREASSYLYRLESQLNIKDGRYKQLRRDILNWDALSKTHKDQTNNNLAHEITKIALGSELLTKLNSNKRAGFLKKAASAAAGAAIGGHFGSKIAKDTEKGKKIGQGIGAIAGYWAAGRR